MESQQNVKDMGGTMRLGSYACRLKPGSKAAEIYGQPEVSERHRHRYEVSNQYRETFQQHGMRLSGLSPDGSLVEMIELPDHPHFVAASSTRSSSRARRARIPSSRRSSPRRRRRRAPPAPRAVPPSSPRRTDAGDLPDRPALPDRGALPGGGRGADVPRRRPPRALAEKVPGGIIFKASFDKANRSNAGAMRGPGIEAGLASLVRVREGAGCRW
jgi:hypothetical protein